MTKFKDIIGYNEEKEELKHICDMLKNQAKYKDRGIYIPKAILLYGEPGMGKTTMAKALITESGRKCFSCKKNKANGEFVEEIRKVFEEAKNNAPSIVFLDDMDKFAEDNLELNQNKEEFATIQSCMEDLEDEDVFVIATANYICFLPDSLLRTGRFGRQMYIDMPDKKSTEKIIDHYMNSTNIRCEISAKSLTNILIEKSPAVIKEVINEANIASVFSGSNIVRKKDLIPAILRIITKELEKHNENINKEEVATHEAGHTMAALLNDKGVSLVTISGHKKFEGLTCFYNQEESVKYDLIKELEIALAGKAAVELTGNNLDYGASKDLEDAACIARNCIKQDLYFGFDYGYNVNKYSNCQDYQKIHDVESKVYELLENVYNKTKQLIKDNIELFNEIKNRLIEEETLLCDDINEIFNKYNNKIILNSNSFLDKQGTYCKTRP